MSESKCTKCAELEAELERVRKQAAAMRDALMGCFSVIRDENWSIESGPYCPRCGNTEDRHSADCEVGNALSGDAGANYVSKEQVKPLVEILKWLHAGSICADPATSAASRKDCAICKALTHARALGL